MKIKDLFSRELTKIFDYISDLLLFFFQPRKYFSIVSFESRAEIIRRFIVYIVIYEIISLSILTTVAKDDNLLNYTYLIGYSIFDLMSCLLYLPILTIAAYFCKPKLSLKITVAYILTYKFTLSLVLVILFSFFLFFENYVFAVLKGFAVYLYILFLWFLFPFIFAYEYKLRIKILFINIGLSIILGFIIKTTLNIIPNEKTNLVTFSLFYDPIGNEVDEMVKSLQKFHLMDNENFTEKYFGHYDNLQNNSFNITSIELESNLENYKDELKRKLFLLDSLKKVSTFNTTKELIDLKSNEVLYELSFLLNMSETMKILLANWDPIIGNNKLKDIVDRMSQTMKYRRNYIDKLNSLNDLRMELYTYGLLYIK